jgi:hypothetical protein
MTSVKEATSGVALTAVLTQLRHRFLEHPAQGFETGFHRQGAGVRRADSGQWQASSVADQQRAGPLEGGGWTHGARDTSGSARCRRARDRGRTRVAGLAAQPANHCRRASSAVSALVSPSVERWPVSSGTISTSPASAAWARPSASCLDHRQRPPGRLPRCCWQLTPACDSPACTRNLPIRRRRRGPTRSGHSPTARWGRYSPIPAIA